MFSENSGISKNSLKIKEVLQLEHKGEIALRIFNFEPAGFIVISAEYNTEPVLGYGFDSNFNFKDAPAELLFLLDEYKSEIETINEMGLKADVEINNKWKNYSSLEYASLKSYSPDSFLLKTYWAQDYNFNKECPLDPNTNERCLVGCTAVALGQILYYWGCMVDPQSSNTYTPPNFTNSLTVNFGNQNYNWEAMHLWSGDDDNAELLFHCGVAIEVAYTDSSTSGSNSGVEYALENYFGFETDGLLNKSSYTSSTWISLLKNDINSGRPVYYCGDNGSTIAHAWIVDGYKTNNEFHCNWGKTAGYYNGWFLLTELTPGSSNYNSNQRAIMGIQPILDPCYVLSGNTTVCSSNVTFTVSGPSPFSVVWSKTGNLTQVGGNTGTTYTVHETSTSGSASSVTATITTSQQQTFIITRNIWAGDPDPDDFYIVGLDNYGSPVGSGNSFEVCENNYYTFYLYPVYNLPETHHRYGITDTEFYFDFDYDIVSEGYDWAYIYVNSINGSSYGLVDVNACNYESEFMVYNVAEGYCGYSLSMSPNPSNAETTLTILSNSEQAVDETAEWELEIYSPAQVLKEKKTKLKGNSTKIQTLGWEEGVYVVRVKYKDEVLTGKLVVKK